MKLSSTQLFVLVIGGNLAVTGLILGTYGWLWHECGWWPALRTLTLGIASSRLLKHVSRAYFIAKAKQEAERRQELER